jgi:hypothetical protein
LFVVLNGRPVVIEPFEPQAVFATPSGTPGCEVG